MINTKHGTGILVFDTNPTCAKVYIDGKLYGTTETNSLQIMNVNPGKYHYSIKLHNNNYENEISVQSNKISHIYVNFNNGTKKEEIVYIGTILTNFSKLESQQCTQPPTQQPPLIDEKKQDTKSKSFSDDKPILNDTPITVSKHVDYYDIANTIATAGATDPKDFDSPIYNKEQIYKIKGRYAEKIVIINDGSDTLYIIISHGTSTTSQSKEVPVYAGETKTYYNVYEIRLRSPTAGLPYRIAEYDIRSTNAILKGTDGTNLQIIKVDSNGNISAAMKGTDGVNLQTVKVDTGGQIISIIKGDKGIVAQDASNRLLSVIQGSQDLPIAQKPVTGELITKMQGNQSLDVAQNTVTGELISVIKGIDGVTLRTVAVDSSGNIIGVLKGNFGGALKTLAVDADGHIVGLMTSTQSFSTLWTGTLSRLMCDMNSLSFIDALPTNTTCVQRFLDVNGTNTTAGKLTINYAIDYTYIRSIAANGALNDKDVIIFLKSLTSVSVTTTDASLNQVIIDYNATNLIKNATPLLGTNAANAVDENFSTVTGYGVGGINGTYLDIFKWDMGSSKTIQGWMIKEGRYITLGGGTDLGNYQIHYSTDNVIWTLLYTSGTVNTPTETITHFSKREGASISAQYIKIMARSNTAFVCNMRVYELLMYT